jgi:hypothetical protein
MHATKYTDSIMTLSRFSIKQIAAKMRGARLLSRHASSRGVQTLAYTWGSGSMGQLGHALQGENSAKTRDGKYIERVPRSVDGLLDSGVAQVRL